MLTGPALTFWINEKIKKTFFDIDEVFETLASKFDTPTYQKQIDHILQGLSVKAYETKHGCSKVEALGYVYNEVDRLNAQGSRTRRGDTFKADQLLKIVDNLSWAKDTKKKAPRENLSFSQKYSEIASAALLWEGGKRKQGL